MSTAVSASPPPQFDFAQKVWGRGAAGGRVGVFVNVSSFPLQRLAGVLAGCLRIPAFLTARGAKRVSPFNIYIDSSATRAEKRRGDGEEEDSAADARLPPNHEKAHAALIREFAPALADAGASLVDAEGFPDETLQIDVQVAVGATAAASSPFAAASVFALPESEPEVLLLFLGDQPRRAAALLQDLRAKGVKTAVFVSGELAQAAQAAVLTGSAAGGDSAAGDSAAAKKNIQALLLATWVAAFPQDITAPPPPYKPAATGLDAASAQGEQQNASSSSSPSSNASPKTNPSKVAPPPALPAVGALTADVLAAFAATGAPGFPQFDPMMQLLLLQQQQRQQQQQQSHALLPSMWGLGPTTSPEQLMAQMQQQALALSKAAAGPAAAAPFVVAPTGAVAARGSPPRYPNTATAVTVGRPGNAAAGRPAAGATATTTTTTSLLPPPSPTIGAANNLVAALGGGANLGAARNHFKQLGGGGGVAGTPTTAVAGGNFSLADPAATMPPAPIIKSLPQRNPSGAPSVTTAPTGIVAPPSAAVAASSSSSGGVSEQAIEQLLACVRTANQVEGATAAQPRALSRTVLDMYGKLAQGAGAPTFWNVVSAAVADKRVTYGGDKGAEYLQILG